MPSATQLIWQVILLLQETTTPEPVVVQQAVNSTTIILALIGVVPASIAAIGGIMALLQSRRNAEVAAQTDKKVTETASEIGIVSVKATEIHTLTNSNLSKVQAQLEVSNKTIEGLNKAQVESARRMASMEQLISSLIPQKGEQVSSSQANSEKLDSLKSMLSNVQQGTPPIPVVDEAVLKKLEEVTVVTGQKLDTIQESADAAAKEKAQDPSEK